MAKDSKGGGLWVGLVVGGLIGTATGLLLAPRSGRDTRRILKKSAEALPELVEDLSTMLQLQTGQLSESAQKNWQETLNRLQEAITAGIEASQMAAIQEENAHNSPANSSMTNQPRP
ncbi:YtxH domain-containing protein [Synechocystis sp. LKSZ1]|uniref:YtxH domain-containing protein n=1 Tax=Synechocystis sp. LKSZ1 TaxID=3144951 RepID=UPI00336BBF54